ncbi:MAG: hypothetical protein H6Q90_6085 [Deltaproteobacteria bacterium]|nr:hypothetical protein [Deltaproteobacteria bacterium]
MALVLGGLVMLLPSPARAARAARALTAIGVVLPIALVAQAAMSTPARWDLLVIAVIVGIVGPASGHIVSQRRIFTRGHLVRIGAAGLAGLLVLGARNSQQLGTALGAAVLAFGILVVAFVIGVALDIHDLERRLRAGSTSREDVPGSKRYDGP